MMWSSKSAHFIDIKDIHLIRKATHYCHPLGDDRFKKEIEREYAVMLGQAKRDRPKKQEN
ncbi:hypothetical protein MNBD_GAMMA07-1599 [hydrothermal vent metagenome]|uniref:Uncharacterized protein n=1 Tax=hydrothermal vent metagenome TaxID=652676 RepID=A0A3B0XBD7_9ZZZZ